MALSKNSVAGLLTTVHTPVSLGPGWQERQIQLAAGAMGERDQRHHFRALPAALTVHSTVALTGPEAYVDTALQTSVLETHAVLGGEVRMLYAVFRIYIAPAPLVHCDCRFCRSEQGRDPPWSRGLEADIHHRQLLLLRPACVVARGHLHQALLGSVLESLP